jgi:vacuolar-type H+-ATPase subunit I/STV1
MAPTQPVQLQYKFTDSWKSIWQLENDDRQFEDPPTTNALPYIDTSLHIISGSQIIQEKGIKMEFIQQRRHTDHQFSEQRKYTDERFSEQRRYMDQRFSEMDQRFSEVDHQFSELRNEMAELKNELSERSEYRFSNIETKMTNFRAIKPGTRISPP